MVAERLDIANVMIWGMPVGVVAWQGSATGGHGTFQYHRSFLAKGLELSPIHMGIKDALAGDGIFAFRKRPADPGLDTFKGLPGLLADCLPDKFGNAVIDAWLARQGRDSSSFNPVERLCYTGSRGMGALEFHPPLNSRTEETVPIEIAHLVELAHQITVKRGALDVSFSDDEKGNGEAMLEILRVGTSAGGARAKAVVAMNEEGHIVSGQTNAPPGYEHWLLKFDGAGDLELGKTQGYGRIEYAYHLMAKHCGVDMAKCRLLEEGGRAHFMTKRFDRPAGQKLHMQSLCGLAHYDYNQPGAYGYEQAFAVMRKLRLSKQDASQQFRRMAFNVIARNQDDHTKNIAFLMDKNGKWKLSPAFDVMYSHDPHGKWTNNHQMTINGKRNDFSLQDFDKVGQSINLTNYKEIIEEVVEGVRLWPEFAKEAGVSKERIARVEDSFRLSILGSRSVSVGTTEGNGRTDLLKLRETGDSGDLNLILSTERKLLQNDLEKNASNPAIASSLKTALKELKAAEKLLGIVDDPEKYRSVDQAHSLPKNRKGGLPLDDARQAFSSHYARLLNQDKSRLTDEEMKILEARKLNMWKAEKLYTERQAKTLGVELKQGKKLSRGM